MMKVISAPAGLKWVAAAVFLTVPIAAFESTVMARAPWWALPVRAIEISAIWAFVFSCVASHFILRARREFYWALLGAGALWILLSAWGAIRTHNPGMGFFTIFIGVYFGLLASWIRFELGRSFLDPDMKWFEGAPRSIPGLVCEWVSGEEKTNMKVSRLDNEGVFLFVPGPDLPGLKSRVKHRKRRSELVFRFREREMRCLGRPMLLFKRDSEGVGFLFEGNSPDQQKDIGDFIETLRGEGYV